MIGCDFSDSRFYHTSSLETSYEYANFFNTNLEETIFDKCDLTESIFSESKIKNVYYENCKLVQAQFFKTSLNGVDLSTCKISGILTRIEDIKGLIVNNFQAIELSNLLGIIIK